MFDLHLSHWPPGVPPNLPEPTNLFRHAEIAAERFPDKPYIIFYETAISFGEFKNQTERVAGYLQRECDIKKGDRVLIYAQNSPQWMIAFYGILRANAVAVPVNPMCRAKELRYFVEDSGATTIFVAQELADQLGELGDLGRIPSLKHAIVVTYSDYLLASTDLMVPDVIAAAPRTINDDRCVAWNDILERALTPGPLTAECDDLCVMPYTSGTTGQPKGCMHTHRTLSSTVTGAMHWFSHQSDSVLLSVLPFFHVSGLTGGMCSPLYLGATVVVLPRWDAQEAAQSIHRYRVTSWQVISTMLVDFLSHNDYKNFDLSSLKVIRGGGAAMPSALAAKLKETVGLKYVEGYGLSETIAAILINPPDRPKQQCLGIPVFEVDARIIDPQTMHELEVGETGELVVHAPQVMLGYWNNLRATEESFIELEGKRFMRTGDLARIDEEGYFFMVDRLKRMINAAGFKVWPAEVESILFLHPAVQEACVIASRDPRRGETVKALIVLKQGQLGRIRETDITAWSREQMAAYKIPRIVEFVSHLPKTESGKVLWRQLQESEH